MPDKYPLSEEEKTMEASAWANLSPSNKNIYIEALREMQDHGALNICQRLTLIIALTKSEVACLQEQVRQTKEETAKLKAS